MEVARRSGAVIFSVDSMQVYRGMDIGTAKPTLEERAEVPHELIDIVDPEVDLTVGEFQSVASERLVAHDAPVVVVGGSGLHFRSIVDPMTFAPSEPSVRAEFESLAPEDAIAALLAIDPGAGDHVDLANRRRVVRALEIAELTGSGPSERAATPEAEAIRDYRPKHPFLGVGIDPGEGLVERIDRRVDAMVSGGLVDEVMSLAPRLGRNASKAVGYAELLDVAAGRSTVDEAIEQIRSNTLALAKKQRTWFRRDPRITWLDPDVDIEEAATYCLDRWHP